MHRGCSRSGSRDFRLGVPRSRGVGGTRWCCLSHLVPRVTSVLVETETITYLGYAIEVADRDLTITAPDGEELVTNGRLEISGARKLIRRHRYQARHGRTNQEV
jgi:hypothetical protein